jgi:hypothetical protein
MVVCPPALDRFLRHFFVTPSFHLVHHSTDAKEQNANFGSMFPWWDRIFNTCVEQPRLGNAMQIGLEGVPERRALNILYLLTTCRLAECRGPSNSPRTTNCRRSQERIASPARGSFPSKNLPHSWNQRVGNRPLAVLPICLWPSTSACRVRPPTGNRRLVDSPRRSVSLPAARDLSRPVVAGPYASFTWNKLKIAFGNSGPPVCTRGSTLGPLQKR